MQRFVDALIKGSYSYLENPQPGNQLIKKDNPEMTDEQLVYTIQKLKQYGIILSDVAELANYRNTYSIIPNSKYRIQEQNTLYTWVTDASLCTSPSLKSAVSEFFLYICVTSLQKASC